MGNNVSLSKINSENRIVSNQAAGIVPCCIGKEDGVGYILLDTDIDMQHTAAREAEEEGLGAVGSINFIRELLLDNNSCTQIFSGCFLAGYGILCESERNWIVNQHKNKKINIFNKFAWEVDKLQWISVKEFKEVLFSIDDENNNNNNNNNNNSHVDNKRLIENKKPTWANDRIRPFFHYYMKYEVNWKEGNVMNNLLIGIYPFPNSIDRWSQWREGKWISSDGKTKL